MKNNKGGSKLYNSVENGTANKLLRFAVILFAVLTVFLLLPTDVFAEVDTTDPTYCPICNTLHPEVNDMDPFTRAIYDMNCLVYGGQLFETKTKDDGIATIDVLQFNRTTGAFASLWATAEILYQKFIVIGAMLAVIYCLVEVLAHFSKQSISPEVFFRELIKLVIAVIVIINGFEIITALIDMGQSMFNTINGTSQNLGGNPENCIVAAGTDGDIFALIGRVLTLFVPFVLMNVARAVVSIICWARILELITRIIFAPIGMSDLVARGSNSNGVKYLKKIMVTMSQAVVIAAFVKAYAVISNTIEVGTGSWFLQALLAFILVISLNKSKDIASDVIGV